MIQEYGQQNNGDLPKELLAFSISRDIKHLFKYLLSELDVLEREKIIDKNTKDFFRARILGNGNDSLRNLASELEKFEVNFKQ